jgi:hypothetical protein
MDAGLVGYKETLLEGLETLHVDPLSFKNISGVLGNLIGGLRDFAHGSPLFIEKHCNPFLSFV